MLPRTTTLALLWACVACTTGESRPSSAGASSAQAVAAPAASAASAAAPAAPATPAPGTDSLLDAADRGRILGPESATVWLLMVSDFQCPFCKQWHDETFAAIKREYVDAGKIRMAYLNFPLSMHANAWPSAMTAMCASAQGKFWATQDRLFQTQKTWEKLADPTAYLDSLAIASGADPAKQRDCTKKRALTSLIERDQLRMRQAGTQSTPTFFVGSRRIEGAYPADTFRKVIDSTLKAGRR